MEHWPSSFLPILTPMSPLISQQARTVAVVSPCLSRSPDSPNEITVTVKWYRVIQKERCKDTVNLFVNEDQQINKNTHNDILYYQVVFTL